MELELEFDHSLQLVPGLRMSIRLPLLCYLLSWHQQGQIYLHVWYGYERREGHRDFVGKQERKRGHLVDVSIDGRIIVKRVLKNRIEGVDFIRLTQDGGSCEYSN